MTNAGTPGTYTSTTPTEQPYKLMRAKKGRMIGGVAAGLAQSSGLDVTVVRICIGITMLTGLGFAAYILMWIVLPEESPKRGRIVERAPENTARTIRFTLIGLAALSALNKIGGFYPFANTHARGIGVDGAVGLILLGIGVSVLFSRHRPDRSWWESTSPPASTPTSSVPRPPAPADGDDPLAPHYFDDGEDDEDAPTFAGPFGDVLGTVHGALSDALSEVKTTFVESHPPRKVGRGIHIGFTTNSDDDDDDDDFDHYVAPGAVATVTSNGLTRSGGAALGWARVIGWFLLIWWTLSALVAAGAWRFGAITVTAPILLTAVSAAVFFAVLNTLLYAKFARAIVPALALMLIPLGIGMATIRPIGPVGDFVKSPPTVHGATLNYRYAAGRLTLDFAGSTFEHATTVNARLATGLIDVTVPNDATIVVHPRTQVGSYEVLDRRSDGIGSRDTLHFAGCPDGPHLTLNLRSDVGAIQVHRANHHVKATCAA